MPVASTECFPWRTKLFSAKVDSRSEGQPECFRPILGIEIFERGSVSAAVSYNCTDDNKYRRRRAVKSNRLRLWALYNQPPLSHATPARCNLLLLHHIKIWFDLLLTIRSSVLRALTMQISMAFILQWLYNHVVKGISDIIFPWCPQLVFKFRKNYSIRRVYNFRQRRQKYSSFQVEKQAINTNHLLR
jgi:hypothetical protein